MGNVMIAGKGGGAGGGHKIGDVLITQRPDLEQNWKLCNGFAIDLSLYPEYWQVAP